ncbi:hypothetical protein GCM10023176_47860 [Micromonospora coerulea]|uniref:Uncharacterized protein n=1 Tax=Micromonospora coerulea TaxID=47856 RepID=A0ABP8SX78_9ACTN
MRAVKLNSVAVALLLSGRSARSVAPGKPRAVHCLVRCLPWWPGMVAASIVAGIGLPWTLVAR